MIRRKPWTRFAALALVGAALAGCSHAMDGASQDAGQNAAAVDSAAKDATDTAKHAAATAKQQTDQAAGKVVTTADKATTAVKKVPKAVDAALLVTPEVKTAIIRDILLNDARNLINVDTEEGLVHLKGHVVNQRMKDRAHDVAVDALRKDFPAFAVSNELTVAANKY